MFDQGTTEEVMFEFGLIEPVTQEIIIFCYRCHSQQHINNISEMYFFESALVLILCGDRLITSDSRRGIIPPNLIR